MTILDEKYILDVKGLNVYFKTQHGRLDAIKGLDFHVKQGEVLGIVGESGCGKSVTSLSVMGLIEPPGGYEAEYIKFKGKDISRISREERRKLRGSGMAMIFQEPLTSLNPLLTVGSQIYEQVKIHTPGISRTDCKAVCIEMLKKTGIPDPEGVYKNYPAFLSGGMRQRVMIAIAMVCNPALLIADEPTTALDVTIQAQILSLMKGLQKEYETAIMFITHDLGVIAETADRVMVMYAGQVVEEADVRSIFHNPVHPYTRTLLGAVPIPDPRKREENWGETSEGTAYEPSSTGAEDKGCPFKDRCFRKRPECSSAEVPLRPVRPGSTHLAACSPAVLEVKRNE